MMLNADPSFVRALKGYDQALDCRWNDKAKRWLIGRWTRQVFHEGEVDRGVSIGMVRDHFHPILHVETDDKEFRQPGQDTINNLMYMDLWRDRGMTSNRRRIVAEQAAQEAGIEKERCDLRDNTIHDAMGALDNGCNLRKWWT